MKKDKVLLIVAFIVCSSIGFAATSGSVAGGTSSVSGSSSVSRTSSVSGSSTVGKSPYTVSSLGHPPILPLRDQNLIVIPEMSQYENKSNEVTLGAGGTGQVDGNQAIVDFYKQDPSSNSSVYFHYGHSAPGLSSNNEELALNEYYVDAQYNTWELKGMVLGLDNTFPTSTLYTSGNTYNRETFTNMQQNNDVYLTNTLVNTANQTTVAGINYSSTYVYDGAPNPGLPAEEQDPNLGLWACCDGYISTFYNSNYRNVVIPTMGNLNNNVSWNSLVYTDQNVGSTSAVNTTVSDDIHFKNNPSTEVTLTAGTEYAKAITKNQFDPTYDNVQNQVNLKSGVVVNQHLSRNFGVTANANQDNFNTLLAPIFGSFPFDPSLEPLQIQTRQSTTSMGGSVYYLQGGLKATFSAENKHAQDPIMYEAFPGVVPNNPYVPMGVNTVSYVTSYGSPVSWNEYNTDVSYTVAPGVMTYCNYNYSTEKNVSYVPTNMVYGGVNYLINRNNVNVQTNYFEGMYAQANQQDCLNPIWTVNLKDTYALRADTSVIFTVNNLFNATPVYKPGFFTVGRSYSVALEYQY